MKLLTFQIYSRKFNVIQRFLWLYVTLLVLLPISAVKAQGTTEILRGRVTADGKPVTGIRVLIVGGKSGIERNTVTNEEGVYTVIFNEPEPHYNIQIRALGFSQENKTISRRSPSRLLINDFQLRPVAKSLEGITVEGGGKRPKSGPGSDKSIGGNERDIKDGSLFSLNPSDIASLVKNTPGVLYIPGENGKPGRFSMLGSSADENKTLLDGSQFEGLQLPADVIGKVSLASSSFDPGKGQFSGGLLSISTVSGSNIWSGKIGINGSGSRLTWSDPNAERPARDIQRINSLWRGPIIKNKLFYIGAVDINRSYTNILSLQNIPNSVAHRYGIVRDTLQSVENALTSQEIPLNWQNRRRQQATNSVSLFAKVNAIPTATSTASLSLIGNNSVSQGLGVSQFMYASGARHSKNQSFQISGSASNYIGGFFNEYRISLVKTNSLNDPYLLIPQGLVTVPTLYSDGRVGQARLAFGGTTEGPKKESFHGLELSSETSWITLNSKHKIKLAATVQSERSKSVALTGPGVFQYHTLQDLRNGQPNEFSRTFSTNYQTAKLIKWALSLGDEWRPSELWRFEYGLRMDAAIPGTNPQYNSLADSVFGIRTDRIPDFIGFSPRFGFSFGDGKGRSHDGGITYPGYWDYVTEDARQGAKLPIYINGGIGAFRGVPNRGSILSMIGSTGLASSLQQLRCIGTATPVPDWLMYASNPESIPTSCVDGTTSSVFATRSPDVQVYQGSYVPPMSWRASLNIMGVQMKGWDGMIYLDHVIGRNRSRRLDRNLVSAPFFTLANEASRPVYAPSTAIIENSGLIAPSASRIDSRFGQVTSLQSDLKSQTTQIIIGASKNKPLLDKFPLSLDYTWITTAETVGGMEAPTAGNPRDLNRTRATRPVHTFSLSTAGRYKWMSVAVRLSYMSGFAYTPLVDRDINGDGLQNDRAFIFDPVSTNDQAFSEQLAQLIDQSSSKTRKCLQKQMGQIAGLRSCQTEWRFHPDIAFGIENPHRGIEFYDRLSFKVTTTNVMSAVTRLLGLSNSTFGRMSEYPVIDSRLLYVEGFDPSNNSYRYKVNQQFGSDRSEHSVASRAPFQILVGGEIRFGGLSRDRLIKEFGFVSSSGQPALTRDQLLNRLRQLTSNPMTELLVMSDSLELTETQITTLREAEIEFEERADLAYRPLLNALVAKKGRLSDSKVVEHLTPIRTNISSIMIELIRKVSPILTVQQKELIPEYIRVYVPKEVRKTVE